MVIGFVDQGDILKSQKHLGALIFLDEIAGGGKSKLNAFSHLSPQAVLGAANKSERDAAYFDPRKTNVDDRDAFAAYLALGGNFVMRLKSQKSDGVETNHAVYFGLRQGARKAAARSVQPSK